MIHGISLHRSSSFFSLLEIITGVDLTAVCMHVFLCQLTWDVSLRGRDLGSRMKKVRARSMA